jgi:hypothetical protein
MQREKKACHFGPPNYFEDMTIMYEKSWYQGSLHVFPIKKALHAAYRNGGGEKEEDHIVELQEEQVTPSPSTGK